MIETYSKNVTVASNSEIPLNNTFKKGDTVAKTGDASIQLNKCGIYDICVNAYGSASVAGTITLQLMVNGVAVPNAVMSATAGDTTSLIPLSFTTKVQVPTNYNENCACSEAFIISLMNVGEAVTYSLVNVLVTKLV